MYTHYTTLHFHKPLQSNETISDMQTQNWYVLLSVCWDRLPKYRDNVLTLLFPRILTQNFWERTIVSCPSLLQVASDVFLPFKKASQEYYKRHLQRRPNNSLGCLEETKLKTKTESQPREALQVSFQQEPWFRSTNQVLLYGSQVKSYLSRN